MSNTEKRSLNNLIDESLFEKIAGGDNDSFTELYYASYKQIFGFLFSLTRKKEDAEDLMQNTYIKIRNGSHLYKKMGMPMTWMCTIAKNSYLDLVRQNNKRAEVDFDEVENYVSEGMTSKILDSQSVENRMVLEMAFSILSE